MRAWLGLGLAGALLAACAPGESDIVVEDAWARETPEGAPTGAIYLTIRNRGDGDDALISVSSDAGEEATLHNSVEEDGIVRMRPLSRLEIPAGARIVLRPGGLHIMLEGLPQPLEAGGRVPVSLVFEQGGERFVLAQIRAMGDEPHAH